MRLAEGRGGFGQENNLRLDREKFRFFRQKTHVTWFTWSVLHPRHPRRFYRNTGMEGWKGDGEGTKVMVFEADMPHCGTEGFSECTHNRPAVWALNDKVSETYFSVHHLSVQ